ncbi:MAG: choice-of-anchor I family protein, partial [Cytophagales bacterium]
TSNNGQCAGGFTWFAPEGGIKAGEVVTMVVENAGLSASTGQVIGSGYGLSSSGEQVFFYMGNNTSPSYITAISTNAWLADGTTHTNCGGSLSLRPSALNENNSISLATAPGNSNGIVVNAYFNGSIDLNTQSVEVVRANVLNPSNWTTAPSGPPQTWPNWSLAGPVKVLAHELISATQLRIVFSKDLSSASATNLSNYSGVAGLVSATVSENGALADTVILTFSSFADGVENTLSVSGLVSSNGIGMAEVATLKFTFVASSKVSFAQNFRVLTEGGSVVVTLNLDKSASGKANLILKGTPFSTASSSDHDFITQEIVFNNETSKTLTINATDDSALENDEYFVIELVAVENLEVSGFKYATIHIKDNDRKAPVASKEIELEHVLSFDPNPTGSTTEAIAYDPTTKLLYATSAVQNRFDVIDFSDPSDPTTVKSVNMSVYGNGITGVAVKNGLVAVGAPANPETLPGKVVFFTSTGDYIKDVSVGVLPDMVTFTPDGKKVLTADEGQPDRYTTGGIDPEGSVSVIDVSGGSASIDQSKVKIISLQPLNVNESHYLAQGVRKTFKNSTLAQDLEPEYITFSKDSKKAWVICQENNAFIELDLEKDTLAGIWALGTKDYSQLGNGADMATAASTQQNVLIANWPVKGYYQPDAIKTYTVNGKTYIVTANEGDEKEYDGLNERTTVNNNAVILDPVKFPHAQVLKQNYNIGGFRISNIREYADPDNDGDYDELLSVGSRSFSIFDAETKSLVYDSGDEFDYITSQDPTFGVLYNASHDNNTFKARSITKGCEPEALDIAEIDGKQFAFIGFERFGGVAVYNITDPENPVFVDYKNTRTLPPTLGGDLGPEYLLYIDRKDSPDGKYYVLVSNEISGTITVFRLKGSILSESDNTKSTKKDFYLYPNPAKNLVRLSEERNVEVMDMSGVLKFKGLTNEINLDQFTKGVYILKTNLGEIRKLVVE